MQSGRRVQPRILQPFSSRCLGASEDSLLAQLSSRVSVVSGAGRASTPAPAAAAQEKLRKYAPGEAMSPEAQLQANVLLASGAKPAAAGPDLSAFDDVTPIKPAPCRTPQADGRRPLRGITFQVFASVSVSIGSMIVGFSSAYTSPGLVSMMQANSTLPVTTQQASWIGSLMPLSALFGGMAGGLFIEWIGRRATILATAIPFIVSWLLIGMAVTVPMVYAGRVVAGFCVGVTSLCLPVYMGETIQPEVRGMLGLISTTLGNIGILVCFLAGKYLNWSNLAFFGAMIPVPFLLCTLFIPETPRWYISKEKHEEASKSLKWLRGGQHVDVSEELSEIEKNHRDAIKNAPVSFGELFNKGNLKPIFISIGLMFFQQLSGINAVIFYTVRIFKGAGSTIDENLSTIVVGIVNLGSTFLATVLIDRLGRRVLLGISAIAMTVSLAALGTFFYLRSIEVDVSAYGWLPLLSFVVFVIGFSLGFGPIPWLMLGEIFPAKIRGPAASLATAFNWACTFVVTKTFTDLEEALGGYGAFWMFGVVCFISLFFVIFCVPETQGRSLEAIEKNFNGKVRRMSSITNIKPMPMAV